MTGSKSEYQRQSRDHRFLASLFLNLGRGIALFFACFAMLNIGGELIHDGFDASIWWIDLRGTPRWFSNTLMLLLSWGLLSYVCQPEASKLTDTFRKLIVLGVILIAARDVLTFYELLNRGAIASQFPLPFSLVVATLLLLILAAMHRNVTSIHKSFYAAAPIAVSTFFCLTAFPLLQIHCFGWTDYRRPADAAVVFGCKVYPNGSLSTALSDRVHTATRLYHEDLVSYLIMSGGPGMGDVHETEAMRDYAVDLGVPADRILTDRMGLSTDETVTNTAPLIRDRGFERILAVSHYFHLPRIKLTYQRAGVDVFTVPAHQNNRLRNQNYLLAREVLALWAYYARPLTGL